MVTTAVTPEVPTEGFVEIDGEGYYVIPDFDRLGPFLMSIVSDSDHWMFVSSRGGLTAGRRSAETALFPYETEDRLHRSSGSTGPVTIIRFETDDGSVLWQPFAPSGAPTGRRNLYKSVVGSKVIFEESLDDVGLTFRYRWSSSDRFGLVRSCTIENAGSRPIAVHVVDGLLDLLPSSLKPALYQRMSALTHAYKRSEVIDPSSRLAVYSLESQIVDRAEPAESLAASVAWSLGLENAAIGMNGSMVDALRAGAGPTAEALVTGRAGAYLVSATVELAPGADTTWHIVADVEYDQVRVAELRRFLRTSADPWAEVNESIDAGTTALVAMMARSDALQRTGDRVATAHHFANITYNVMRGGIFESDTIKRADFAGFLRKRNRGVAARSAELVDGLPDAVDRSSFMEVVTAHGDPQLIRLALEYLPLTFSRRHGDPSRPWNEFAIRVRDERGDPTIHYQGNWRDIFQNWEALCLSFPEYLPSVVSVFVNASTPDGFNPYRITSDGIEWEVPEPENPWSNIGYWGDHQIVYLLRLLEATERYLPGQLERLLGEVWFSYADVPYRLVPYEDMVADPKDTIVFDTRVDQRSAQRAASVGSDGRFLWDDNGDVHLVTLLEKLIVPALSKLSNFIPGAGIWMNTQRPEWNDANNALVGHGVSMVTLYHLRRYLRLLGELAASAGATTLPVTAHVAEWLHAVADVLRSHADLAGATIDDVQRRRVVDDLGSVFTSYRSRVYAGSRWDVEPLATASVVDLCEIALVHIDSTIAAARRHDGLFHSYNLIHFRDDGPAASVEHLYEMLEGQVAVLGAGVLTADEQADVLDALFGSSMYRSDQRSFMLYPARSLPSFLDKNVVAAEDVAGNPLLTELVAAGDRSVVTIDPDGVYRFSSVFSNGEDLELALDRLAESSRWADLVALHRRATLATYERAFNHHSFTGRSGTMYGYEGIGSIYWHMVAKLLVAVQEAVVDAHDAGSPEATLKRLIAGYWRVRSGLGFNKTAEEYGAFPTDPYSHTPAHAGAQQPGMTGQVKEEILTRLLEVGVRIESGEIVFDPVLLRGKELVPSEEIWPVADAGGQARDVVLSRGSLGLTICQVPVTVRVVPDPTGHVTVEFADGERRRVDGLSIDAATSRTVFARTGEVAGIAASIPARMVAGGSADTVSTDTVSADTV